MTVRSITFKQVLFFALGSLLLAAACGPAVLIDAPTAISPASIPTPQAASALTELALSNTTYSENIRFEHIGLEEGLSQSVVYTILQDRQGFLWVGTQDGLNRFDGYKFKVYRPDADNPFSLSDYWITSLVEDPQGYLWIGTRLGGLNRYDPKTGRFTRFIHSSSEVNSISNNHVNVLLADENGLWVGTEAGLDFFEYDSEIFKHFHARSSDEQLGLSSDVITALYRDRLGKIWIGTADGGLNRYDKQRDSFDTFQYNEENPLSLSSNRVLSIQEDRDGNLWVGTGNGLNRLEENGNTFARFLHNENNPNSPDGNTIYVIQLDRSGGLWIGTNMGLDRYDAANRKFIHHRHQPTVANSLNNNTVFEIYEDRSGVIWVGTYGAGLNKYNRQQDQFAYYRHNPDKPDSLSGNFIMPILVEPKGTVWIGAYGDGLELFYPSTGRFIHYRHDPKNLNSLASNEIISLALDSLGMLWIGTSTGLDRFDPGNGKFTHFSPDPKDPHSLSGAPVYFIYEDDSGQIWVGTSHGLDQYHPVSQSFESYEANGDPDIFKGKRVTTILQDNDGSIWVGTFDNGLKRIDPKSGQVIQYMNDPNNPASLGSNSILNIYQDHQGALWIGTFGGGLNRYEPASDSFTRFTEKNGLPNNVIYGILEDHRGMLWLSTNYGLSRFNPVNNSFRNFTSSDGLQSNEFNQNAFAKGKGGEMYFGGINGFDVFTPETIIDNFYQPSIVLTSLTEEGAYLDSDMVPEALPEITLTWPQDSFEFEFAALTYGQPSKNQYAYMLENFDKDWNNIGAQHNGRYTNLPGGTYTLRLRGSNSDGVWNNDGLSIKVTVVPPYWQTWWFRVMLGILAVVGVAGSYRLRLKGIENHNRDLERLVQKRTADLEKRNIEMEALYQADEKILRNVTLNQVFQTLVDVSVAMLNADRSLILAWDEEQTCLVPRVSFGFKKKTLEIMRFARGEGIIGKVLATGQPIIEPDLNPDDLRPDIRTAILEEGIKSFAHLPIKVDEKVVAVFNVGFTHPNAINDDILRLYSALVQRASLSIANMELFEQTKDLAVIEERNRLARDLHDSAKQKAFAALAQLGAIHGILKINPNGINPHLAEAETLVYEVIQELTFLIQEIYPIALQEKGLATTLREYIFEWETRNDIVVNLSVRNERPLPLETEQAIYRVIQEALANVSRHSQAKRVEVSLVYNTDSLQVSISDDGRGFEVNQRAKGMGFRSMRERIGSIHGTIQTQSAPGQGTRVIVQVPIKEQYRDQENIKEVAV